MRSATRRSPKRLPRFLSRRSRRLFSARWSYRNLPPARAHAHRFESLSRQSSGRSSAAVGSSHRRRWRFARVVASWRNSRRARVGRRFTRTHHWQMTPCWRRPAENMASRWSRAMPTSIGSCHPLVGGATRSHGPESVGPRIADLPTSTPASRRASGGLPSARFKPDSEPGAIERQAGGRAAGPDVKASHGGNSFLYTSRHSRPVARDATSSPRDASSATA